MKYFLCLVLVTLLGSHTVAAHRRLNARASVSSSASSTGGGTTVARAKATAEGGETTSASAESKANNCAQADTTAIAEDGATVSAKTDAESVDCAPVKASTTAVGKGNVTVDKETKVKSDQPVNVTVYTQRVEGGENITIVAIELVDSFTLYTNATIVKTLLTLASQENSFALFEACINILYERHPCTDFKLIVAGYERELIVYKVAQVISECIYPRCSAFNSAKSCCGEAQLEQDQCACADGKCDWQQPSPRNGAVPYWICNDCGYETELCVCA